MNPLFNASITTPLGAMTLVTDGVAIRSLEFDDPLPPSREAPPTTSALVEDVQRALDGYFARTLRRFDLPLAPAGTPFQQAVWKALCGIPYGETVSYAEIARRVGVPSAVRAVGAANGRNPIPIVIPCHRVIGADGRLVGYSAGLDRKRALLALEAPLPLEQAAA
jgi:methylated-DNA-[protein]-cysteine S-methyltransferase